MQNSWMLKRCAIMAASLLMLAAGLVQASEEDRKAELATEVVHDLAEIPEQGIPPALLSNAHAIAVIPRVIKAGLIFGGRYGNGLLVVRDQDGRWSSPSFVNIYGGSFGLQIGVSSTDVLLVFKDSKSVEDIIDGKVTLGADAAVAAGPVGRSAEAATDAQLEAEVYSYSRSRGLFAGVSLEGAVLQIDDESNSRFYGRNITAHTILSGQRMQRPASAQRFIETLDRYTPRPG